MELWDAYDENFNKIEGVILVRGEAVPKGLHHLVCDVIVKHADGTYLLMRRDPRKTYGGMWEATAGGSALMGESPEECARRELFEETGIKADALLMVGKVVSADTIYCEYFCETDCEKGSVVLQAGETDAFKWASREELLSMKREELVTERMQRFISELQSRAE